MKTYMIQAMRLTSAEHFFPRLPIRRRITGQRISSTVQCPSQKNPSAINGKFTIRYTEIPESELFRPYMPAFILIILNHHLQFIKIWIEFIPFFHPARHPQRHFQFIHTRFKTYALLHTIFSHLHGNDSFRILIFSVHHNSFYCNRMIVGIRIYVCTRDIQTRFHA